MYYQNLLDKFIEKSIETFGTALTGVYLHGSLAMGCFQPEKSDLDLLVVVREDISDAQKWDFMQEVVRLNESAPEKGIEVSVVQEKYCRNFVYPTPFELHFSTAHLDWFQRDPEDYVRNMKGTDKDLAAHFTITRTYGVVLYGAPILEAFGEVPREDYIDSIWYDVEGAEEDILENPMYVILNLCRVMAYLKEDLITSKKQGGEWMLERMEQEEKKSAANCELHTWMTSLIQKALACYAEGAEMQMETGVEKEQAREFAREMLQELKQYILVEKEE